MEDVDGSLLNRTRALLNTTQRTYLDIHSATGLSPNWLSLLARGKLVDPSVNRVQKLYEALSGDKLLG